MDGVEKVTSYLSCKKCNATFPFNIDQRILHCANCGCAQLRDKCPKRTIKDGDQVSLTIFEDKVITLHNIFKPTDKVEDSSSFTEDNITELLLSVEAITSIKKKD